MDPLKLIGGPYYLITNNDVEGYILAKGNIFQVG